MSDSEIAGYVATITRLEAERDAERARAELWKADADRLAAELANHGHGDFHYTPPGWRDPAVLEVLAAHDALVAEREGGPA